MVWFLFFGGAIQLIQNSKCIKFGPLWSQNLKDAFHQFLLITQV